MFDETDVVRVPYFLRLSLSKTKNTPHPDPLNGSKTPPRTPWLTFLSKSQICMLKATSLPSATYKERMEFGSSNRSMNQFLYRLQDTSGP